MTRLLHIRRLRDGAAGEPAAPPPAPGATEPPEPTEPEPTEPDAPGPDAPGPDAGTGPRTADDEPGPRRPPRRRLRRAVLAAVAAALVLAGCGFFYGAHRLTSDPSARNRALTDAQATTRVAGDVGNALARVFSYTPDGLAATERSARSALDGRAARQYAELIDRIRADLARQRVTLSTQAVRTGVVELDGDSARLLVFLDQVSRRDGEPAVSAAAQLTVTARRDGDQWRIVDIRTR